MANLESTIRTRFHRDVADEDVLRGGAWTGFSRWPGRRLRLNKAVIPGLASMAVAGRKTPLRFVQQLHIPPGEVFLSCGALDAMSDGAGTLEIPLAVSKKLARTAALSGP
jgi:hypothetical protein